LETVGLPHARRLRGPERVGMGEVGPFDYVILDAITLFNSMGKVEIGRTATQLNRSFQNHDRGSSIYIVIAID
jgi:hypothetical protein